MSRSSVLGHLHDHHHRIRSRTYSAHLRVLVKRILRKHGYPPTNRKQPHAKQPHVLKMKMVLFSLLLLVLLAAVLFFQILNRALTSDAKEEAEYYIDLLINGDYEAIIRDLDPKITKGNEMAMFSQMGRLIPEQAPNSIKLVNNQFMRSIKVPPRYLFTYHYEFEQRGLNVTIGFRKPSPERTEIFSFQVYPIGRALKDTHRFSLQGKKGIHYFFLTVCVVCPLFILYTLLACIRTKLKKRKWPWIIFILVGFVQFSLNWTRGEVFFKPLSIQLLGAGAVTSSVYAPWILTFSIPVGAIIFWIRLKNIRKEPILEKPRSGVKGDEWDRLGV